MSQRKPVLYCRPCLTDIAAFYPLLSHSPDRAEWAFVVSLFSKLIA
jgi:hypothetical protein